LENLKKHLKNVEDDFDKEINKRNDAIK